MTDTVQHRWSAPPGTGWKATCVGIVALLLFLTRIGPFLAEAAAAETGAGTETVTNEIPLAIMKPATAPLKHFAAVTCARFSPDGRRFLTASSDNGARLWDTATAKLLTDLSEHDDRVLHAEFSPDGRRFLTASADNTARVWNAENGDWITGPMEHAADVLLAYFSPDGRTVATVSDDKRARFWNATNGEPTSPSLIHSDRIVQAAFPADGKAFVTLTEDGTVRTWSFPSGEPLGLPLSSGIDKGPAELSPDGRTVLSLERNKHSRLVSIVDRRVSAELTDATNTVLARFSRDGRHVLTVQDEGVERIWDVARGTAISTTVTQMKGVTAAAFSRDGRWLAVGHKNGELRVRAVRGRDSSSAGQHTNAIVWVEFSPDGKSMVTGSLDGTAILWRIIR
jgi:WD40 repeat protein